MKKEYLLFVGLILYQVSGFSQFDYDKEGKNLGVISEQLKDALTADLDSLMLDSIIIAYKNSQSIPGIATMIIKENEIIWNKNYGYRNLQNQLPVEDSTLFLMASVSKTFVAAAVMQLWENGMIDLQGNINNYLPTGFIVANPHYPSDVITVKMLMTHTSSLLDNWNIMYPLITCGDSPISLNTFLVNYLTPGGTYYSLNNFGNYHPGQQWNYTSVGCGLLALIIENMTGKSFDEYCRDSIFIPLSMNSTSWFLEGLNIDNIATPYDGPTPICHQGWPLYPGAFLRTNKIDLSKFLLAYMNNGVYNNVRILDSTTISYMLSDQLGYSVTYQSPWWVWKQGLLWFNAYPIDDSAWGHAGSWPGCLTYMCYDPLEKWGTIWFQNWRPTSGNLTAFGQVSYYFTQYADSFIVVEVEEQIDEIPSEYVLSQNYPNPFNPNTTIKYSIPTQSKVVIKVYDILGNEIALLMDEEKTVGTYELTWNAASLPSGVYFYQLRAGEYVSTKKMILLK